ncbi:MAG: MFS transporter [Bauldia litoralis]
MTAGRSGQTPTPNAAASAGAADRRRYVLVVLTLVGAFNHFDRHLLAILLERIKADLVLSDLQLGLLSGVVFGGVYAIMGIPISLLAARSNRRNIIVVALTVWSALTVACGVAQNFWQLALARFGVGIGEAGGTAPSHSMISDLYPEGRRAGAMAFYGAGANLGLFLAMIVGGTVAALFGWRWAFIVAGVPGLILALVVIRLPEPVREAGLAGAPSLANLGLLRATLGVLRRDPCLRNVIAGTTLNAIVIYGMLAWVASYLIRVHDLSLQVVGIYMAIVLGLIGGAGTILGGIVADRLARRHRRWYCWVIAGAILVGMPFMLVFLITDVTALALTVFVAATVFGAVFLGLIFSILHDRVDSAMRPVASAITLFVVNLLGLGIGPVLVGALSDYVFPGGDGLRYALVAIQVLGLWAALHYFLGGRALSGGTGGQSADPR